MHSLFRLRLRNAFLCCASSESSGSTCVDRDSGYRTHTSPPESPSALVQSGTFSIFSRDSRDELTKAGEQSLLSY